MSFTEADRQRFLAGIPGTGQSWSGARGAERPASSSPASPRELAAPIRESSIQLDRVAQLESRLRTVAAAGPVDMVLAAHDRADAARARLAAARAAVWTADTQKTRRAAELEVQRADHEAACAPLRASIAILHAKIDANEIALRLRRERA